MKMPKNRTFWIYLTAIMSIIFLGYAILFRPPVELPPEKYEQLPPDSAFKVFIEDEMDYRTDFSYTLVEQRIERLKDIALVHPETKFLAQEVIDSLEARLKRGAVIKKKEEE